MNSKLISLTLASALLAAAGTSVADHNSKNGEGTANMPNDIHNTRVETMESNDNEAFRDFVKYGEGSKTVNRFESEETQPNKAIEQKGNAKAVKNQGESKAMNQNRVETQTNKQDRSRIETRTRLQPRDTNRSRPDRSASSARDRGGRKGGGRQ
ncbi:MAG: hypothetical protein WBM61_12580 [Woeseiaceae bacterium]|jgi:hypothetical protein